MALVTKCDRCGALIGDVPYPGYDKGPYVWELLHNGQHHFDLCNKCYKSLLQWIKNPEEIHAYKYMIEDTKCCLTCKHLDGNQIEKCPDCGDDYSKWEAKE